VADVEDVYLFSGSEDPKDDPINVWFIAVEQMPEGHVFSGYGTSLRIFAQRSDSAP
jgi:hypothetical protein